MLSMPMKVSRKTEQPLTVRRSFEVHFIALGLELHFLGMWMGPLFWFDKQAGHLHPGARTELTCPRDWVTIQPWNKEDIG